jgi:hypothetical protein
VSVNDAARDRLPDEDPYELDSAGTKNALSRRMADPKYSPPVPESPEGGASFIRPHEAPAVVVPPREVPLAPTSAAGAEDTAKAGPQTAIDFLDDWALRHFTASVKIHDVERVSEHDPERRLVLEDLGLVQGVLLELHDFATADGRVRAMMDRDQVLQNGVSALYTWLDDVLTAAARLRVTRGRPSFVDAPGDEVLSAIGRSLERVHPDLQALLRVESLEVEPDVARKLALCFRQIGAAVVRVSGRTASSYPPKER